VTLAPETARDRRRLRTRRELAETAVRLFETRGFAATTVEDIAAAADYSPSTFFRLFPRKEDPVFFDMPERLDELSGDLGPSPGWPQLRAALIEHARTWEVEDPEFAAARVRLFHSEPALTSRYLDYCRQYEEWLAGLISARSGGPPSEVEARLTAACIVAALRAAFHAQASTSTPGTPSVAAYLEQALDTLEAGPLRTLHAI
jgi:AcrR family transcriptional regulator